MSTTHTPGPWTITEHTEDETSIYGPDGGHPVCSMTTPYVEEDDVENPDFVQEQAVELMDANARLIAAAPDLLDTLKTIHRAFIHLGPSPFLEQLLATIKNADPCYDPTFYEPSTSL